MGTATLFLSDQGNTNMGFVVALGLVAVVAVPMFGELGTSFDEVVVGQADASPLAVGGRGLAGVDEGNGSSPAGDSIPANLTGIELSDSEPVEVGDGVVGALGEGVEGALGEGVEGALGESEPVGSDGNTGGEESTGSGGGFWGNIGKGVRNLPGILGDVTSSSIGAIGGWAANGLSAVPGALAFASATTADFATFGAFDISANDALRSIYGYTNQKLRGVGSFLGDKLSKVGGMAINLFGAGVFGAVSIPYYVGVAIGSQAAKSLEALGGLVGVKWDLVTTTDRGIEREAERLLKPTASAFEQFVSDAADFFAFVPGVHGSGSEPTGFVPSEQAEQTAQAVELEAFDGISMMGIRSMIETNQAPGYPGVTTKIETPDHLVGTYSAAYVQTAARIYSTDDSVVSWAIGDGHPLANLEGGVLDPSRVAKVKGDINVVFERSDIVMQGNYEGDEHGLTIELVVAGEGEAHVVTMANVPFGANIEDVLARELGRELDTGVGGHEYTVHWVEEIGTDHGESLQVHYRTESDVQGGTTSFHGILTTDGGESDFYGDSRADDPSTLHVHVDPIARKAEAHVFAPEAEARVEYPAPSPQITR